MGSGQPERGSNDKPVADLWAVVAGADTGGIVVRQGVKLDSKVLGERLSTGAIISTMKLQGNRVHYSIISGTGPENGWVSIRMQCTELIVKIDVARGSKGKNPTPEDPMVLCLEESRKAAPRRYALPAKEPPKGPLPMSRAACLASHELILLQVLQPHIQRKLRTAWEESNHDKRTYDWERRRVLVEAAGPVLALMGFDATWEGFVKHRSNYVRAQGNRVHTDDAELRRQIVVHWLQSPDYQRNLPWTEVEMHDIIVSLRDPEGARAEAKFGGFVGHWRFDEGHFDIVPVNSKLRVVFTAGGFVWRGDLIVDDIWHRALLCNGLGIRFRRSDKPLQLLMSVEGACGWTEEYTAHLLGEHELASYNLLQPQAVSLVRRLATCWSVAASGPPEAELADFVPVPLLELSCSACDERRKLLRRCTDLVKDHFFGGTKLVYASSAGLWFDWWTIEKLLAMGFSLAGVHVLDARYTEELVRASGMQQAPLGDLAAWGQAVGVRCYAHKSLQALVKCQPKGAHLLVQGVQNRDPQLDEACMAALRDGGLLIGSQAWMRQNDIMVVL